MTLSTNVYVLSEANVHEVFHFCRRLLGCKPHHAFTDGPELEWVHGESHPRPGGYWTLGNVLGQGLPALLEIDYRDGRALRLPGEHTSWCDGDCDGYCRPCWLDIDFDTTYSYQDEHGGCGDLHARLVAQLGRWLDSKGIRWAWKNEFNGDVHAGPDKYERLADLCSGGAAARHWFTTQVLPAIAAEASS